MQTPIKQEISKMTYQWNSADVETYAKSYSKLICKEYFLKKEIISGADILNLTEIKQVNLLIIRVLFERWQEESIRIKSPYFDFEKKEVKLALTEFMNVLSRFISVKRRNFENLLSQAVYDSLQLCLQPSDFFENLLKNLPNFKLTHEWLETNKKYIYVNRHILESLEKKLGNQTILADQAMEWVNEIFQYEKAEITEDILDLFDKKLALPIRLNPDKVSFFEEALTFQEVNSKNGKESLTKVLKQSAINNPDKTIPANQKEALSLNDKLISVSKTLNEKILNENGHSLSESHQKSRLSSLKRGVTLNQRFVFINNLFAGNQEAYSNAMEILDDSTSLSAAKEYLTEHIESLYKWDHQAAEVEEFYMLINRKFS